MLQLYDIMKYGSAIITIFKTNFLDINQLYAWQYFLLQSNDSHIEKQSWSYNSDKVVCFEEEAGLIWIKDM